MFTPGYSMVPWWWRFGLPSPIWYRNIEVIRRIVEKNKLQPFSETFLNAQQLQLEQVQGLASQGAQLEQFAQPAQATAEATAKRKLPGGIRPWPFPGGLKIAHVHFEDRVYPLDRVQWQEFSTQVVQRLTENLAQAKGIGFQQLMEVSEVVEVI